jgi:hypothetical protein
VIWGGKVGDSFQVHVFGDPGMEMMPECNGRLCYGNIKQLFSNEFIFLYLLSNSEFWGKDVVTFSFSVFLLFYGLGDMLEI